MAKKPIFSCEEDKWRAQSDARTMREYQEIINDPERVKNAKKVIVSEVNNNLEALGEKPVQIPDEGYKHSNPATLGKLNITR